MTEPTITYGLWIERVVRQGTQYVVCRVMKREDDCSHPINAMDRFGDPGPYVEGLVLEGWVSDYANSDGSHPFCGFEPAFRDVYSCDSRKAKRILATLRKVEARIAADEARDAGDVFMSFARAIGARWAVSQASKGYGSSLRDSEWEWRSVPSGRDLLRHEIATAMAVTRSAKVA